MVLAVWLQAKMIQTCSFRFFDTDSGTFTKEGSWLMSDDEMNFGYHDGDGAGAQTDSMAYVISGTSGIQVLDSKFNKGITYVSVDMGNFTPQSVPNVEYVDSVSLSQSDQSITGPNNRELRLEESANLEIRGYDTTADDWSDRAEIIFAPERVQLRYDEGDQAGGTNGYAELDFDATGVTVTNTLTGATTLFDVTDGTTTFFDVTTTGVDVTELRATSVVLNGTEIQTTTRQAFDGTGIVFPSASYRLSASTLTAATAVTIASADILIADKNFEIKDESGAAATSNITIVCEGGQTIDGQGTVVITANYGRVRLYSDGTNLFTAG